LRRGRERSGEGGGRGEKYRVRGKRRKKVKEGVGL